MTLRAPFPRFGGKSAVAAEVWRAFGDPANYVEPFFGTGAVLLARPTDPGTETVNDADCYLANFWRATQADPEAVARHADWPVNEADLHARHLWLVRQEGFRERMKTDPDYFDAKIAGWWVWGCCSWIGSGWCEPRERGDGRPPVQLPRLGDAGMGVHWKLPELGSARGILRVAEGPGYVYSLLAALSERLRRVRVACGDWSRVCGDSVTWRHGVTAVFLDPPYGDGAGGLYAEHDQTLSSKVRAWAIEAGARKDMRIALCGYEGEHEMPSTWRTYAWKARGGYGSQREDGTNENARRERVWFSPHCLGNENAGPLFAHLRA